MQGSVLHFVHDKRSIDYTSAGINFATLKYHDSMMQYAQHKFHKTLLFFQLSTNTLWPTVLSMTKGR